MSLKRLRSSAAISGSDRSSANPTLRKLARCASKLGSTDIGSAILSESDFSLYRAFVDIKNELELTSNSTRKRVMANFIVADLKVDAVRGVDVPNWSCSRRCLCSAVATGVDGMKDHEMHSKIWDLSDHQRSEVSR